MARTLTDLFWLAGAAAVSDGCGSPDGQGGASGGPSPAGSGETVELGNTEAIVWGEGERGTGLAHGAAYDAASREDQGRRISESVAEAAGYLKQERGVRDVALIGASAGSGGVLGAAEAGPGLADGLILLSGTGDVSGLGEYPKLSVASEGEELAATVRNMAQQAPGDRNEALILPGDARAQAIFDTGQKKRLVRAILELLEEGG